MTSRQSLMQLHDRVDELGKRKDSSLIRVQALKAGDKDEVRQRFSGDIHELRWLLATVTKIKNYFLQMVEVAKLAVAVTTGENSAADNYLEQRVLDLCAKVDAELDVVEGLLDHLETVS